MNIQLTDNQTHTYSLTQYDSDNITVKRFHKNGNELSKFGAPPLYRGKQTTTYCSFVGFSNLLETLKPNQVLSYGVFNETHCNVVSKGEEKADYSTGKSRSKQHVSWAKGNSILFLDFDGEFTPEDVKRLRGIMLNVMPELYSAPQIWRRSNSGCLIVDGVEKKGGLHCYIGISDGTQTKRIGEQFYKLLWIHGYGHIKLSKIYSLLPRTLIDLAVFQPERLDYAAKPIVQGEGLECVEYANIALFNEYDKPLNCSILPPLSDKEEDLYQEILLKAKEEIQVNRVESIEKAVKAAKTPKEKEKLYAAIKTSENRSLTLSSVIYFEDNTSVTVEEIFKDLEKYHNRSCYDPRDGDPRDYKAGEKRPHICATIYTNKVPMICSFGHGGNGSDGPMKFIFEKVRITSLEYNENPYLEDNIISCVLQSRYKDNGNKRSSQDMFESAAVKCKVDVSKVEDIFNKSALADALMYHKAIDTLKLNTFKDALDIAKQGDHMIIQARLGSGKTSKLIKQFTSHLKANKTPVLILTALTSLVSQISSSCEINSYRSIEDLKNDNNTHLVATIDFVLQALTEPTNANHDAMLRFLNDKLFKPFQDIKGNIIKPVLIIDEASLAFDKFYNKELGTSKIEEFNTLLMRMIIKNCQLILLDADITLTTARFAKMYDVKCYEVLEYDYENPGVLIHQEDKGEELLTELVKRNIDHKTVIACDSADSVDNIYKRLKEIYPNKRILPITSNLKNDTEQSLFLDDPNYMLSHWDIIVYSPVLSAGYSITSFPVHTIVYLSSLILAPNANVQLARRFRKCIGDIDVVFASNALIKQSYNKTFESVIEESKEHASSLMLHYDFASTAIISNIHMRKHFNSNPMFIMYGHFLNIGFKVSFADKIVSEKGDYNKEENKEMKLQEIANSDTTQFHEMLNNGFTIDQINQGKNYTQEDKFKLKKFAIEYQLGITSSQVTTEIVKDAHKIPNIESLYRYYKDKKSGRYSELDIKKSKANIVKLIVEHFKDGYNSTKAKEYLPKLKKLVKPIFNMREVPDVNSNPNAIQYWYKDLLSQYGYRLAKSKTINGTRNYIVQCDLFLHSYIQAKYKEANDTMDLLKKHGNDESVIQQWIDF